jgi:hypothetical protein
VRLTGADFEHGKAVRLSDKICCTTCLTPDEKEARVKKPETPARKASFGTSRRYRRTPPASTSSRSDVSAALSKSKKTPLGLILGGVGGGVLLLAILLAVALSRGDTREWDRGEIGKRATSPFAQELDSLKIELAGPLERGHFRVAQAIIDRARGRHSHSQWRLEVENMGRDVTTRARNRLTVLIKKAAHAAKTGAYEEIREIRREVSGWGPAYDPLLKDFDKQFETVLAGVTTKDISVTLLSPTPQAQPVAGEDLLFTVELSGPVERVEYRNGSAVLGNVTLSPFDFTWRKLPQGLHEVTVTAYDNQGRRGEPVRIKVMTGSVLVRRGWIWKYLDTGKDQGTAWRAPDFDDSSWKQGPAKFGYGSTDQKPVTILSFGPNGRDKFPTTYFRHAFEVDAVDARSKLSLKLKRDDGVVVYLNGKEVVRSNMPEGDILYQTRSAKRVTGGSEDKFYETRIDATPLVSGRNLLAAELHQYSKSSSDVCFDLELSVSGWV